VDAEGTFTFSVTKSLKARFGWLIAPRFSICLDIRDFHLLKSIKDFFGGIGIIKVSASQVYFDVNSVADLAKIISHFNLFPLQSSKRHMFHIFVILYNMYRAKEHLTLQGFLLAIAYINILNKPIRPDTLKAIIAKHGLLPCLVLPPVLFFNKIIIPSVWWIIGFICGEGSFTFFPFFLIKKKGLKELE